MVGSWITVASDGASSRRACGHPWRLRHGAERVRISAAVRPLPRSVLKISARASLSANIHFTSTRSLPVDCGCPATIGSKNPKPPVLPDFRPARVLCDIGSAGHARSTPDRIFFEARVTFGFQRALTGGHAATGRPCRPVSSGWRRLPAPKRHWPQPPGFRLCAPGRPRRDSSRAAGNRRVSPRARPR